ncbi:hypothetical protein E5082_27150 [Streptomyces griseoluteus]|uniref:Uncharacterized protein n=1 Tax=Streptomyces griseoluteus TaxID=29306 RepID=A0A4Z1D508_STRGP|nr:hypothetical protein E5082_27150 [Streptomyces griseoluteus]
MDPVRGVVTIPYRLQTLNVARQLWQVARGCGRQGAPGALRQARPLEAPPNSRATARKGRVTTVAMAPPI